MTLEHATRAQLCRCNVLPLHYSSSHPLFSHFIDGQLTLPVTDTEQASQPILSEGLYCEVTLRYKNECDV